MITSVDLQILHYIEENLHHAFLDVIFPWITSLSDHGEIWIGIAVILIFTKKYRKAGMAMLLALFAGFLLGNCLMKPWIGRIRPFDLDISLNPLISPPSDFSFPSGHTMHSFSTSFALFLNNRKMGIPALILASLIALSRLYLLVHYPSDVIGGALLGLLMGYGSVKLVDAIDKRIKR